ncbi:mitochondrial sodium/calcium exchanger protein [Leptonychotes weddellii]|uniref:Mitochondrial sodium/calcium exchanger protein n=1 Tax=Leptonychotes weddellii TaxID=9713 RepID=A0A7F8RDB5_LEPWE|nr:mitochondrial sodium/calcium exchanger protein [Leptonychotes weddellii]
MVETVSGARGPFTGAHIGPQFSALGVNQTPTEDVSIQCRDVCGLNISDRCDFVRTTPDCLSQGGYLNYLEGIFCHFPPNLLPLVITLYAFWLLYLFLILGVTAAKFFCPNLSAISTMLKLSHNVAGVTFLAFGNGAPDIFSTLVAFSDPRTASLAFGALFGSSGESPTPLSCPSADGVYDIGGLVPVWAIVVIAGTAVAAVTFFATSNSEPPRLHWLFAFLGFLTSALWINAAATEVVNILQSLGVVFQLSNTVLGLTLLAWGNSIGDAFSDFTLARQGYPRMAFSACFGGIILNLLVGVGLGCLLQISRSHAAEVKLEPDGLLVWVLAGALGLSLVCSLVSVPLQCFRLNKVYGFCLLLFYVNFLVVALLTEFGVIHLRSA